MEKIIRSKPENGNDEVKSEKAATAKGQCVLCGRNDESDMIGGELLHDAATDLWVHELCMFFSPNLVQAGDEDDPLRGFNAKDIIAEQRRGSRLNCTFCKKKGATLGCCESRCKIKLHLPCGRENKVFHEFFGSFRTFCEKHLPLTPIKKKALKRRRSQTYGSFCGVAMTRCPMCTGVIPTRGREILWSTCCRNACFHWKCVQDYALKAGSYHIRCPLCKNEEKFKEDVLSNGVYVPIRDAEWEKDNDDNELFARPNRCAASSCFCPFGENYDTDLDKTGGNTTEDEKWAIAICNTCGAVATHVHCATVNKFGKVTVVKKTDSTWMCGDCNSIS